jgi:hypothetical protein
VIRVADIISEEKIVVLLAMNSRSLRHVERALMKILLGI